MQLITLAMQKNYAITTLIDWQHYNYVHSLKPFTSDFLEHE